MKIEVQTAEQRDEKFTERAAKDHEGVAAPTERKTGGFVDHQVDEIGKEKAGGVAEGVEEEEKVGEEEPGDTGIAGDMVPGLGFGERAGDGDRVAMGNLK